MVGRQPVPFPPLGGETELFRQYGQDILDKTLSQVLQAERGELRRGLSWDTGRTFVTDFVTAESILVWPVHCQAPRNWIQVRTALCWDTFRDRIRASAKCFAVFMS
jgi:hypothetical protein